eukprot:2770097-Prymnesium_polylepis.1
MCWKCDAVTPRCRFFSDPFWMWVTRPCAVVSEEDFGQLAQELVWQHFPGESNEAPPEAPEADRQVAASRLVILRHGTTALNPVMCADLVI